MVNKKHADNMDEELQGRQQPGSKTETVSDDISSDADGTKTPPAAPEPVVTVESIKAELMDRILRLQADFDNYRRRTRQEQMELGAFVTLNLIKELLPVVDNFERALASRPVEDPSGFGAGVDMIFRQLYSVLEKQGITAVETVGSMFDPNKHEAILKDADSGKPDGTVVEELQKGYAINGKVVRPALVKVAGK
jgi:molecular chaperone GrpE